MARSAKGDLVAMAERREAGKRRKHDRARNVPHPSPDPDGVEREVRTRPEASMHGSASRQAGTNGSWPAAGANPKPPAICALYEDLIEPSEMPTAVFGQYPRALIGKVLPYLRCERHEILHVCSGSLPQGEGIRVDIREDALPDILADGRDLPLADGSQAAVMLDPPYTEQYARDLYGVDYPRPSHLLREAARVVRPCGRIAFVHYLVPMPPPGCSLVRVLGLSTGFGFPMRAVTIFQCEQDRLFEGEA
jgi:hypothetical protein